MNRTVKGDHSFMDSFIMIKTQDLTTASERIFFTSLVMVLGFSPGVRVLNPARTCISAMHLFIYFSLTDFVRKIGAPLGVGHSAIYPICCPKMDFLPTTLLAKIMTLTHYQTTKF